MAITFYKTEVFSQISSDEGRRRRKVAFLLSESQAVNYQVHFNSLNTNPERFTGRRVAATAYREAEGISV